MQRSMFREMLRVVCAFGIGLLIGAQFFPRNNFSYRHRLPDSSPDLVDVENQDSSKGAVRLDSLTPQQSGMRPKLSAEVKTTNPVHDTANGNAQLYITAEYNGRLGNLLFQFASAYGIARQVGKRVHTVANSELLSIFPRIRQHVYVTEKSEEVRDRRVIIDTKHCAFAVRNVDESRAPANVALAGYFQSWRYFNSVSTELREMFTFRDDLIAEADQQILAVRKAFLSNLSNGTIPSALPLLPAELNLSLFDNYFYVAMHVRLGDIVSKHYATYGYQVAPAEYLRKTVSYFAIKYRSPRTALILLVFTESDSVPWCRTELVGLPIDHMAIINNDRRELDLAIMTRLNGTIMTVGSFGWWAAYLSNHETFYYGFPFRPDSQLASQFNLEDYYPLEWRMLF